MAGEQIWHVYLDITLEENPRPFYVGKGTRDRISKVKRNRYWECIAAKYGHQRTVLLSTKDESYAFEIEIVKIREYRTFETAWEKGEAFGANLTAGGEGMSGVIVSEETRRKMSAGLIQYHASNKRPPITEEKRQQMSLIMKGRFCGENHPMYGKRHTEEALAKMSAFQTGRFIGEKSPLWGKKLSEDMKLRMSLARLGEKSATAILSSQDIPVIRQRYAAGATTPEIARDYKVSKSCIAAIVKNENWQISAAEFEEFKRLRALIQIGCSSLLHPFSRRCDGR